jgi:hypothetical protein
MIVHPRDVQQLVHSNTSDCELRLLFNYIVANLVNASARACSSIADNACYLQTVSQLISSNFKATTHDLCKFDFFFYYQLFKNFLSEKTLFLKGPLQCAVNTFK